MLFRTVLQFGNPKAILLIRMLRLKRFDIMQAATCLPFSHINSLESIGGDQAAVQRRPAKEVTNTTLARLRPAIRQQAP